MLVRYRYRAYPTSGQAGLLAGVSGCPRAVFKDALAPGEQARCGVRICDTAVKHAVVIAGTTPEQAWRGEAASVAGAAVSGPVCRVSGTEGIPVAHGREDVLGR